MGDIIATRGDTGRSQAIVIGASAAGLFAAFLLAKGGLPVLVVEERECLGSPARTLIITQRLGDVLGFIPSAAIVNQTRHLQLFSGGRCATICLNQPDWIVEREKLIQVLAAQARNAGAQIVPGHRFVGLEPDHDGLVVHLESSTGPQSRLWVRHLIGADGACSRVAQASDLDGHGNVFILQAKIALSPELGTDTTQVWFDPKTTPYFYWCIPESPHEGVVGLIARTQQQAQEGLRGFLAGHGLDPIAYQGAQVASYRPSGPPWKKISQANIFLIGDAAAQVKMTTVGGAVTGLRGARAVATAILSGTDHGAELKALCRRLRVHGLVRRVLNGFGSEDYDQLLELVNQRAHRVLSTQTRDDIHRVLALSLLAQPRFLLLAARGLRRSIAAG